MPFSVGDRVTCNAAKVLEKKKKRAKQRYGRPFKKKEILGVYRDLRVKGVV